MARAGIRPLLRTPRQSFLDWRGFHLAGEFGAIRAAAYPPAGCWYGIPHPYCFCNLIQRCPGRNQRLRFAADHHPRPQPEQLPALALFQRFPYLAGGIVARPANFPREVQSVSGRIFRSRHYPLSVARRRLFLKATASNFENPQRSGSGRPGGCRWETNRPASVLRARSQYIQSRTFRRRRSSGRLPAPAYLSLPRHLWR